MARTPSVILTPAEKKLALTNAKDAAKAAKVKHAELTKAKAKAVKEHDAKVKELTKAHDKAIGTISKEHAAAVKAMDKDIKLAEKDLTSADGDVIKLGGGTVKPSVTGPLVDDPALTGGVPVAVPTATS